MPWGVEDLSEAERFAKAINAGVDQIGGTEESSVIVQDVHNGLISEDRVREAARRVLLQKFQLGLFEQPYVDEHQASALVGNATAVREGEAAQARAVVLFENKPSGSAHRSLLPISRAGQKIYVYGVAPAAAEAAGFVVVSDPAQADFAIVRAPAATRVSIRTFLRLPPARRAAQFHSLGRWLCRAATRKPDHSHCLRHHAGTASDPHQSTAVCDGAAG